MPATIEKFTGDSSHKPEGSSAALQEATDSAMRTARHGGVPAQTADRNWGAAEKHLPNGFSIGGTENAQTLRPGDHQYTTMVDRSQRHFEIHVPPNYDGSKPIPVMVMMPGMGGSIEQMKHETGMNGMADQRGFAVVYTEALPKPFPGSFGYIQSNSWNLDHGSLTDKNKSYDDLDYMREVERQVGQHVKVDKAAQYIVGFSEGGGAAQYVAESMPHTFAGVGSVHGTHLESDPLPRGDDKTAFVAVLGNDDNMLPLSGGHGFFEGGVPIKGIATITIPRVSQSEPLEQKNIWAVADHLALPVVRNDGHDRVIEYSGNGTHVTEIIRNQGMHAWDGLGQNPKNQITHKPDFGWPIIGVPNPEENTSRDVVNALMPYRKDGKHVNMQRNFMDQ